jgi:hypothetical protein
MTQPALNPSPLSRGTMVIRMRALSMPCRRFATTRSTHAFP